MKITKEQLAILLEEIAIITIMCKEDLKYKDAKLVYTYPDLKLGRKLESYQTKPY